MVAEEPESVITGQKTGGEAVCVCVWMCGGAQQQQTETKKPNFRGNECFVASPVQAKQLKLYHKLKSAHSPGGHTTTRK